MRARALARSLARSFEVHLVDGGREVPGRGIPDGVRAVPLPRIERGPATGEGRGELVAPLGSARSGELGAVLRERAERLREAAARVAPELVVVEHFPFSKWELREEILALLRAARDARGGVRAVASVRDVCPRTAHEAVGREAHERAVLADLAEHFDLLLVHADPRFTRLEEHFGAAGEIVPPVRYTGFVTEDAEDGPPPEGLAGRALVAFGGGRRSAELAARCLACWPDDIRAELGPPVLFEGLFWSDAERAAVRQAARAAGAELRPFGPGFAAALPAAALAVGRAGYNTSAAVLRARVPAVLIPDERMSDQGFRAARLDALGLAAALREGDVDASRLASAARRAARARSEGPSVALDLDGAERTRALLAELVG